MGRKLYLLESLKLEKGNTFEFGIWDNKPIEWQVLAIKGDFLCISKYCLEERRFDEESNDWKTSELRQWLNSDFFNRAFSFEEKSFMLPYEGDKVTLLSIEEVQKYFPSKSKRIATYRNGKETLWWLRTPLGYYGNYATYVDNAGGFEEVDYDIYFSSASVRPVILLKKDVENFLEPEEV